MGLALRLTQRRIKTLGQEMNQEWERVNRQLAVSIKNLLLMQIYGTQVREEKKAQNSLSSYRDNVVSYFRILGFQTFLPQVCGFFIICLICYASRSYQLLTATATVTYLYVFIRFLQGVAVILQSSSNWILYWPHVLKLAEWWANHSHDGIRRSRPIEMMMPSASPALEPIGWKFSNVRFSYPGATSEIIRDFDLEVEPGSAVVITGPSGSGKTTLLHLMLGTLIPMRGQVDVLFQEGRKISLLQYRSSLLNGIGYVGPESFLIEGTIYQNLTYGLLKTPSEIEVKEALTLAECHFVFDTPAGLQSQLTEQGHGLSAGQKQRLSLARALLRHPKALILDEATANLDLEVESKLVDTLSRLKNKITVVAVTHREGLLRIADKKIRLSGT
jgi:ABC-type multidrug transport system fused ATPase/permease subunit